MIERLEAEAKRFMEEGKFEKASHILENVCRVYLNEENEENYKRCWHELETCLNQIEKSKGQNRLSVVPTHSDSLEDLKKKWGLENVSLLFRVSAVFYALGIVANDVYEGLKRNLWYEAIDAPYERYEKSFLVHGWRAPKRIS